MSALRNALRPALTPALGSARGGVSRYFTEFNVVAASRVELLSELNLNGRDYEVEFDVFGVDIETQVEAPALGRTGDNRGFIRFSNGVLNVNFSAAAGGVSFGSVTVNNSELSRYSVKVVNSTGDVTARNLGSGASQTLNATLGNSNFNLLGSKNTIYTDNIWANYKVWADGDRDTGALILDMPINRYYTPQNNIVLDESGSGNNGTFVNIAAGRSKYYQQRADGDFVDLQGNVLEVAY